MSELISKETLIYEIVNTPTNSDCYNSAYQTYTAAYLSGSAARQFEILDIVKKMPTVSEQEIRNKVIEEFVKEAMKQFTEFDLKHGYPTVADCEMILKDVSEQMKEVEK